MKITLDIDLEKFRYSLVGDGYLLEEVKEMTDEELVTVLVERVEGYIEVEYEKSRQYGLLDETDELAAASEDIKNELIDKRFLR